MSTYGTAVVLDIPPEAADATTAAAPWTLEASDLGGGWTRMVTYSDEIEQVPAVERLLAAAGSGRAAVAEDHDEYGALWVVLASDGSALRT